MSSFSGIEDTNGSWGQDGMDGCNAVCVALLDHQGHLLPAFYPAAANTGPVGKGFHVRSGWICWRGRRLIDKTLTEPPGASARSELIRFAPPASATNQQKHQKQTPNWCIPPPDHQQAVRRMFILITHDKTPTQPPTQVTGTGARGSIRRRSASEGRPRRAPSNGWMAGWGTQ